MILIETMRYTDFRLEMYALIDEAIKASTNPHVDSIHIHMDDAIDLLNEKLTKEVS